MVPFNQPCQNRYLCAMVHSFTFNPVEENTYIIYDETGECIIIDPGCYTAAEKETLRAFILDNKLTPVRLLNTHCHFDHVLGNKFVSDTWNLSLEIHRGEMEVLERYPDVCRRYGIMPFDPSPMPNRFIEDDEIIRFGDSEIKAILAPGHSPASLAFYNEKGQYLIAGDVLFLGSIGRTDLPGGDHETLLQSIRERIFVLPGETLVYPGHGRETTIRHEVEYNPFF